MLNLTITVHYIVEENILNIVAKPD